MASIQHTRVPIYENPRYQKSGIKSYVSLLQKYGFKPTRDGPFFRKASFHSEEDGPHKKALGLTDLYSLRKSHHLRHETPAAVSSEDTQSQADKSSESSSGRATTDDQQNDSMYLTPVLIGDQPMILDFDTGSSDLWVWSVYLDTVTKKLGEASNKHIYDPSKSSPPASPMAGSTWKISYGDGSFASGTVVTDTLTVGGIKVNRQAIECAQHLSPSFVRSAGDGLLGLAMGNINTVKPQRVQTPVENMITQQDITNKLFTAYLGSWRDAEEDDKGQSFYTFGYVDEEVLKHSNATEPYYTPLVNPEQGFWKFASPSYTINGESFACSGNTAIADTGTTLALVADTVCDAIYKRIPKAYYDSSNQGYVFPTDTKEEDLPLVGFAVGSEGKVFTCGKEDLLFAETAPGWTYGGIQSRGDLPFDILGDTWLKGVYAEREEQVEA
ncbi:aspartic endopeptidase [Venturia nashicola]|uniref:Aspartic endopeptidase n=1 Tax=Venturia nashicola TaxID=86259 RepID=A0A4Z1NL35_9PEZI|nr:aspartic endopeptidase [Venturia nashicola]